MPKRKKTGDINDLVEELKNANEEIKEAVEEDTINDTIDDPKDDTDKKKAKAVETLR